jgi:hypothetical protein
VTDSLCNAATLVYWLRFELGAEIYLEPDRDHPDDYHIRLRAPKLRNRVGRIFDALNRNVSDVVQLLLAEQRQRGSAPAGAEVAQWAAL